VGSFSLRTKHSTYLVSFRCRVATLEGHGDGRGRDAPVSTITPSQSKRRANLGFLVLLALVRIAPRGVATVRRETPRVETRGASVTAGCANAETVMVRRTREWDGHRRHGLFPCTVPVMPSKMDFVFATKAVALTSRAARLSSLPEHEIVAQGKSRLRLAVKKLRSYFSVLDKV
jgi:hypothetical protein